MYYRAHESGLVHFQLDYCTFDVYASDNTPFLFVVLFTFWYFKCIQIGSFLVNNFEIKVIKSGYDASAHVMKQTSVREVPRTPDYIARPSKCRFCSYMSGLVG